jgi:RsiW-degrading membrane proteinase PrsW (M82 family)
LRAGAAVGLGFNLTETVRYMTAIDPSQAATQFWSAKASD